MLYHSLVFSFKYNTRSHHHLIVLIPAGYSTPMASHNSSCSSEHDSLNQSIHSGLNILLPSPFQGGREDPSPSLPVAPLIPQPRGVINMANVAPLHLLPPILAFSNVGLPSGFPSTPGQPSVGHAVQSSEYNVMSNSYPVLGERQINHIPQGGNININSHNSSLWSSGFTNALQDHSLDLSRTRQPPSHTESASKVSHSNTNNAFQQLFDVSRDIVENTYFYLVHFLM